MDLDLWIRYLFRYGLSNVVRSDQIIENFRLHPISKTVSQRDGFIREGKLLSAILIDSAPSTICPRLVEAIQQNSAGANLDRVRRELIFHNYATAYAMRDWDEMAIWMTRLLAMPFSFYLLFEIINLECRRIIVKSLRLEPR